MNKKLNDFKNDNNYFIRQMNAIEVDSDMNDTINNFTNRIQSYLRYLSKNDNQEELKNFINIHVAYFTNIPESVKEGYELYMKNETDKFNGEMEKMLENEHKEHEKFMKFIEERNELMQIRRLNAMRKGVKK